MRTDEFPGQELNIHLKVEQNKAYNRPNLLHILIKTNECLITDSVDNIIIFSLHYSNEITL